MHCMFDVDPDIRRAHTPPAELYANIHRPLLARWHLAPHLESAVGSVRPFVLVLLSRSADAVRCLSKHTVELEDEAIVENVQRGVRSPLYKRGRYSPTREIGVHHFHRMLVRR